MLFIFQERNVNVIGVEERYVMNENDLNAVLKEGEGNRQYPIQYFCTVQHITELSFLLCLIHVTFHCDCIWYNKPEKIQDLVVLF